jgi:hypothetical protein
MAIKYFDILKQYVNTGKPMPEYQLKKVMGMPKGLAKSYFRARINMMNADMYLKYQIKEYEVNFFETLEPKIQKDLIEKLENFEGFIEFTQNPDKIASIIIAAKGNTLRQRDVFLTLKKSKNPDNLAKMIINSKGVELDSTNIYILVKYAQNFNDIMRMIVKAKGDTLDTLDIKELIEGYPGQNYEELINIIGEDMVYKSLRRLYSEEIIRLLENSKNPDYVKRLLLNAGISKEDINKIIRMYKINTDPIP